MFQGWSFCSIVLSALVEVGVMQITLLTTDEACELLRCEKEKLRTYREQWIEGIHFVRCGQGKTAPVLYNRELILDWLFNQTALSTHHLAIEWFRRELPSGRLRGRPGRSRK